VVPLFSLFKIYFDRRATHKTGQTGKMIFFILSLLIGLCICPYLFGTFSVSVSDQQEQLLEKGVTLSSGVKIKFTDKRSAALLSKWANDIDVNGGTVSHTQAVQRESQIVGLVNSGQLSFAAYEDYQRLAAGTGNVDSARLLMQYGVGAAVNSIQFADSSTSRQEQEQESVARRAAKLASRCDVSALRAAFASIVTSIGTTTATEGDDEWSGLHSNTHLEDGTTLLLIASYVGCLDVVSMLLEEEIGADVELVGANGVTALMAAAGAGHVDIIKLLVTEGNAIVNAKHKFASTTALHMAAEMVHADAVRELCRHGADPHAVTSTGGTPIHTLAQGGMTEQKNQKPPVDKVKVDDKRLDAIISAFKEDCSVSLEVLMNGDTTPLYLASQYGNTALVQALLRGGANLSFSMPFSKYKGGSQIASVGGILPDGTSVFVKGFLINSEAGNGAEAIHAAAEEGHADTVLALIQGGANPNTLTMAVTPLHLAAQYNRPDVAKILIQDAACDVNTRSYTDGATALYYAAGHGFTAVVKEILESPHVNTSITQKRSGGFPLFYAAIMNQEATFFQLMNAGADVHQTCPDGNTALSGAINALCVGCIKALLTHKDARHLVLESGNTLMGFGRAYSLSSLSTAVTAPHSPKRNKIISLLLNKAKEYSREEGGNALLHRYVNSVSLRDGATALHYAARQGDELTCSMLLERGADVQTRMQDTHTHSPTVLYLAVHSGNVKLVALLLLHGADPNDGLSPPSNVTPLLAAIDKGNTKIAIMLLNGVHNEVEKSGERRMNKADPNKGVGNGGGSAGGIMQSPLLYAVVRGRADIVKHLLAAGAFCNIIVATPSSPAGETLVDVARRKRDFDVLQALMAFKNCNPEIVRGEL